MRLITKTTVWVIQCVAEAIVPGGSPLGPLSLDQCALQLQLWVKWMLDPELEGDSSNLAHLNDVDERFSIFRFFYGVFDGGENGSGALGDIFRCDRHCLCPMVINLVRNLYLYCLAGIPFA